MRRWLIVVSVTLGIGMLAPSLAAAEPSGTVSISASPEPAVGQPVSITVSGISSQPGELVLYTIHPAQACPDPLPGEGVDQGIEEMIEGPTQVTAGSYSQTYSVTPNSAGTYTVCGYLYEFGSHTIYAGGTGSFILPTPSPPPPHLTSLTVEILSHPGHTAAKPGVTDIKIWAPHVNAARVVLKRLHHANTREQSWKGEQGTVAVPWTCSRPGGVYVLTVTARDSYGKTLTRHGKFRPVSAARCRALHTADARRRPGEERERAREQREEAAERRHDEREQASEDRGEQARSEYCEHVLGGIPFREVRLDGSKEEVETDCVVGSYTYILRGDPPYIAKVVVRP